MATIYSYQGQTATGETWTFNVDDLNVYDGTDSYITAPQGVGNYNMYNVYGFNSYSRFNTMRSVGNDYVNGRMAFLLPPILGGTNWETPTGYIFCYTRYYNNLNECTSIYETVSINGGDWQDRGWVQYFPHESTDVTDYRLGSIPLFDFSTNVPIFSDYNVMWNYLGNGWSDAMADYCVNYIKPDTFDETTKYYFIGNQYGEANTVRHTATATGDLSWRSLKFMANTEPVLYYDSDSYTLTLIASKVLASYTMGAPLYILDNVPESAWQDGLTYSGNFYGNIPGRMESTGEALPDGTYTYGFYLNTNIYIFKDRSTAEAAQESGDYSAAVNYAEIGSGNTYNPPNFGDEEQTTTFGQGGGESLFSRMYIFTTSQLRTFASAFFDDTTSIVDAILDGLKMYGANPIDVVGGLKYFPCDLTSVCNATTSNYIYFGSYKMDNVPNSPVVNLSGGKYIDAGTIFVRSLFNSYRDFEPYTQLQVYLPYIGWQKVDIAEIINKSVNIRYYVDIITGRCVAAMVADGVLIDYWNGYMSADLAITAADVRQYSASALQSIFGGLSQTLGGGFSGAQTGAQFGGPWGAVAGAALGTVTGGAVGSLQTTFELEKLGLPKDHIKQKGSMTGLLNMQMPQSVIWRYDIHEALEPNNFNAMCGRPSTASGKVSSFSGFLSCKSVKLNQSGMTDAEAKEILSLLKTGIYV